MRTYEDLWIYLCNSGYGRSCSQFYNSRSQTALAFWNGVLTALEIEGKVTKEDARNIWAEIDR